jgi:hypothetical protein
MAHRVQASMTDRNSWFCICIISPLEMGLTRGEMRIARQQKRKPRWRGFLIDLFIDVSFRVLQRRDSV